MIYYPFPTKTYMAKAMVSKFSFMDPSYELDYVKNTLVDQVNQGCEGTLGLPVATRWRETDDIYSGAVAITLEVDIWMP